MSTGPHFLLEQILQISFVIALYRRRGEWAQLATRAEPEKSTGSSPGRRGWPLLAIVGVVSAVIVVGGAVFLFFVA